MTIRFTMYRPNDVIKGVIADVRINRQQVFYGRYFTLTVGTADHLIWRSAHAVSAPY